MNIFDEVLRVLPDRECMCGVRNQHIRLSILRITSHKLHSSHLCCVLNLAFDKYQQQETEISLGGKEHGFIALFGQEREQHNCFIPVNKKKYVNSCQN